MCDINSIKCDKVINNGDAYINNLETDKFIRIMLTGDVMLGRAIDSSLPFPFLPDILKSKN